MLTRLDIASERFDLEHSHRRSFADQWRGVCTLRIRLPWLESGNHNFIEPITRIDAQASHRSSVGHSQGKDTAGGTKSH